MNEPNPRRAAALKAWKTRRKPPSDKQRAILMELTKRKDARFVAHYLGKHLYFVHLYRQWPGYGDKLRTITVTTFLVMLKRGWIAKERERHCGGLMGTLPDGTHGIVEASVDHDYVITDKGRKALATANEDA